ncbi:MAG: FKBP-type peptidyl-prolyl cis-trans isomerase [Pedosphaera sp.]|nr:FKBP-type peptidyl-prolyl cis-trans isomerase [Pedosphaera sp.]
MRLQLLTILTVGLCVSVANAQPSNLTIPTNPPPKTDFSKIFKSDKEKISYAIGMSWGSGLKNKLKGQDIDYDVDVFAKGFKDNLGDGPSLITEAQEKEILTEFSNDMRAKGEAKRKQQAEENRIKGEKNKADGQAFLEKNKTVSGVVTTTSGLQYKVITEGSGDSPKVTDEVSVNYRGTLIDGTEFDSSFKRNQPFTTRVQGGIIKGWTEVLQLMKPGAKWTVYIPADLAYGVNPMGPIIGPNSTLIFELELLTVKPGASLPTTSVSPGPHGPTAPLTSDIIKVPSAEEMKKGAKIETIKAEDIEKERAKATNQ